jgi:hypothetical protein
LNPGEHAVDRAAVGQEANAYKARLEILGDLSAQMSVGHSQAMPFAVVRILGLGELDGARGLEFVALIPKLLSKATSLEVVRVDGQLCNVAGTRVGHLHHGYPQAILAG